MVLSSKTQSHRVQLCDVPLVLVAQYQLQTPSRGAMILVSNEELEQFLYEKCKEDYDLLAEIISKYVSSLSDSKLEELEDFMVNNFGDD